jgi:hypothetical protein
MQFKKSITALVSLIILSLVLAACGAAEPEQPTPTPVNVDAIKTEVAQAIQAEMTQIAASYSPTPEPTATDLPPTPESTSEDEATPIPTQAGLVIGEATPTVAFSQLTPFATLTPFALASPTTLAEDPCDISVFVSDVSIPDGTVIQKDQWFTKTWRVQNTGTCRWSPDYRIVFGYGDRLNGTDTRIDKLVGLGETVDISVRMQAPSTAGEYIGHWRLMNLKGYFFGTILSVKIKVP